MWTGIKKNYKERNSKGLTKNNVQSVKKNKE